MESDSTISSPSSSTMDSNEGVSMPLIHEHLMVPWNSLERGDCCGEYKALTDGFFCEECDFFVHKKCSESCEYIQHPSHPDHTLQLGSNPGFCCDLCGIRLSNVDISYRCTTCDFNMHLYCAKNPPPDVIEVSTKHCHKLTLVKKQIRFYCDAKCRLGSYGFTYKCEECDVAFHVHCVWHPPEVKHLLEYITIDAGERVSLPWIHEHFMMPCNDLRKGDCCGLYETISDGYYCKACNFFVHKKCGDQSTESVQHPSHPIHLLWLGSVKRTEDNGYVASSSCHSCGNWIKDLSYRCRICDFEVDICCGKYPPPEFINASEKHHHKLTFLKKKIEFDCDANCGNKGWYVFPYKCDECDLFFHVDCVWQPNITSKVEVNHSYHPWHPLTLHTGQPPEYSDGKCRLCGKEINDRLFYHCSACNFTLDICCFFKPPPRSLLDLKAHDHQLTLLPRLRSFTCNACGLSGDRSPYVCLQCDFMIHQECLRLPRVININRHDHRVSRTSVLGVVNSVCGVCRKKVDWTCGGYSCQRCPNYVVHFKCATREDVWNGKELEGVPEEKEDIEPYVVIDENTIQHFSHSDHYLKLNLNGVKYEENKWCNACSYPVGLQSFYECIHCVFNLHQSCAELPKKKRHILHNDQLTLATISEDEDGLLTCDACHMMSNGFVYHHGDKNLDVRCGSILEPFVHRSHPQHSLYSVPRNKWEICCNCDTAEEYVLRCIEDDCEFVICFRCATLPQVVKHRVDDHPLTLCYGEEEASGKYWCDICEKESNPRKWFYTCKDHRASLHTNCVLGDYARLRPRSTFKLRFPMSTRVDTLDVVLNNSVTRLFCRVCKLRCIYPILFKWGGAYVCSYTCFDERLMSRFVCFLGSKDVSIDLF